MSTTPPKSSPSPSPSGSSVAGNLARAGASLGLLASLALLGYGVQALLDGVHTKVLCVALLVTGVLEAVLSWYTLRGSRVAWSFASTLNGTLAVVFLFAAPTIRDALGIGLLTGFIPFFVFVITTGLLALGAQDPKASE